MHCTTNTKGCFELDISPHADWREFERLASQICQGLGAQITSRLDGLDARYWDLAISGRIVTLHLHDMVGISIFANDSSANEVVVAIQRYLGAE
jgi:hypothetical protein